MTENGIFVLGGPETQLHDILWAVHDIFLALASTTVFSVMDGPKNVMQLRLGPAQDEKPIFCQMCLFL